jgi:hypothetical protein
MHSYQALLKSAQVIEYIKHAQDFGMKLPAAKLSGGGKAQAAAWLTK